MGAYGETVFFRGRENLRRFLGAESSMIAEYVHESGQFSFRNRRHHFVADQVNIFLGKRAILRRDRMRAQKSWNHGAGKLARGSADGFERLQFRFQVESIARFGLNRSSPMTRHIHQRRKNFLCQRGFAGLPHAVNTGANASSSFGDLFIASTRNPLLEIHQPRMRENRMRMRIDEAGQDHASVAIDLGNLLAILLEPRIAKRVLRRAHRNNLAAQTEHRSIMNDSKFGKGSAASRALRRRAQREKLADTYQQESGGL